MQASEAAPGGDSPSKPRVGRAGPGNGQPRAVSAAAPGVSETDWHHLAVTKSGSDVVFYVDGARSGEPAQYDTTFEFSSSIAIGSRGDGRGGTFLGMIDEPAIFSGALTPSGIRALY